MSTPDALLKLDPSTLPDALREPLSGVPFTAYLLVEAARLDGLEARSVLDWLGVREADFDRVEERWGDLVSEELAREDGGFDEVYTDLLGRALSLWSREVAPLDRDIGAWMAYERLALLAAPGDPIAERVGLTRGDELRLARLWGERIRQSESLAATAAALWSAPPSHLPDITLSPFVLPKGQEPI